MENIIKYSVLRYSPSFVTGESINLGIIITEETHNYREFYFTKKIARVTAFDDSVKRETIITLLTSIKNEVEGDLFSSDSFSIEEYTKYYNNNYCFERPKAILFDDFNEQVEDLKRSYFRFDYEKSERPSLNEDLQLIERSIRADYREVRKNTKETGPVDETLTFDFVAGDYKIKILDLDSSRMINTAKTWAWNCMYSDKIILIYRFSSGQQAKANDYEMIMNVFQRANVKIYNMTEGIDYLHSKLSA